MKKLKYFIDIQKGKLPKLFSKDSSLPVYLSMDYLRGNMSDVRFVDDENVVFSEDNDILILWDGSNAGEILLAKKGVISSTTAILKPKRNLNKSYLFYQLKSSEQYFKDMSVGMGIPHVNPQELLNFSFFIHSLKEQIQIVNYLDQKTAEIDQLIADKKRLLELYEEEKTVIINQAVTKGINPDVPMKDSEIEWLGEIPEHWEVKKLKYVAHLKSGINIVSQQIKEDGEYPVFGGNGLRGYYSEYTHNGNHVLIGRQGAYCGNIKYGNGKFWASEHAVVLTTIAQFETIYIGELLRTMNLNQYSVSAAQPGLAVDMIKNLSIPFPPIQEQQSIVHHIETETARINEKIETTQKLIELLTEYRTVLISEIVTGKIKVI